MPDPSAVRSMFGRIAGSYDLTNHLLSGGVDFWWRRKLVRAVHDTAPTTVLDLATGSGDVAFELADGLSSQTHVVGMDFCQPMLDEAVKKQSKFRRRSFVTFAQGDGMALPLGDAQFDAITISFGLRNMADRHQALSEMRRVLRPAGSLFVLEFSQPSRWFRPLYYAYLKRILPVIAGMVTGDRSAYEYLCGSIEQFPDRDGLSAEILRAGFSRVSASPMFPCGIVALHHARK